MTTFRAVIFDLGDTLLDLHGQDDRELFLHASAASHRWMQEQGIALPSLLRFRLEMVRSYLWSRLVGHWQYLETDAAELVTRVLKRLKVKLSDEQLRQLAFDFLDDYGETYSLFDGVIELLEDLGRAGIGRAILSNTVWTWDYMEHSIRDFGLHRVTDHRIYSADFGRKKPCPDIFRHALARLGTAPSETIMVGNSYKRDARGGKRVGLTTVWIDHSPGPPLRRPAADYPVADATEMIETVRRLTGTSGRAKD